MATTLAAAPSDRTHLGPMLIIGLLFFIFGFVTWLNGPLITFVKLAFELDDVNAFLVPMAFYLSYFFLALPASLDPAAHRHEEGHGAGPVRDGGRRGAVRPVRHAGACIPAR